MTLVKIWIKYFLTLSQIWHRCRHFEFNVQEKSAVLSIMLCIFRTIRATFPAYILSQILVTSNVWWRVQIIIVLIIFSLYSFYSLQIFNLPVSSPLLSPPLCITSHFPNFALFHHNIGGRMLLWKQVPICHSLRCCVPKLTGFHISRSFLL